MPAMKFRKKFVPKRAGDDAGLRPGESTQQTVKRDGVRVVIKQTMRIDGTIKTTVDTAHTLESDLQAAQVSRLKAHPDYGKRFLLAGDQNAAKRGPVAAAEAKRTGMEAGEPDLRVYAFCLDGVARTILIENKNGGGYLSREQKDRHEALEALGFAVWVIKTDDVDRAADCAVRIVDAYLSGNVGCIPDDHEEISRHVEK